MLRAVPRLFALALPVLAMTEPSLARPPLAEPVAAAPASAATTPQPAMRIIPVRSPGGISAWLVQDATVPVLALEISFRGAGGAADPAGKEGLARFAAALLDEGAGDLDAHGFQSALEAQAIQLRFDAGTDTLSVSLRTLSEARAEAFRLTGLALTRPRFDADAVDRMRRQFVLRAKREQEDPDSLTARLWYKTAFPDHPYGRGARGTVESLSHLERSDLLTVLPRLARERMVIGVAGDITPEELGPLLDSAFAALPAQAPQPLTPPVRPQAAGAMMVLDRPLPQAVMLFGDSGLRRDDPDWYAASLAVQILGGSGMSSRLFNEIREKRGLTYGIGASLANLDSVPLLMGRVASENGKMAQVLELLRAEWAKMAAEGPAPDELSAAKTYLTGSLALSLDSTSRVAGLLVNMQIDHLPLDHLDRRAALIDAVTLDDVRRLSRRLFDPARLSIAIVGQPTGVAANRSVTLP